MDAATSFPDITAAAKQRWLHVTEEEAHFKKGIKITNLQANKLVSLVK